VKEFLAVQVGTVNRPENRMTNARRVCAECGATVFAHAPEGLCSVCLFRTGLVSPDYEKDEAPTIARMLKDFGDYELLEEIGRGGQGVVYRARQKSLNRIVALKVIGLAHWATEAHVKRFRMEAEAAASLDDPRIVPIYEIGERDGACYYSMKFIEGGQLDKIIGNSPMPGRKAAELMAKLAHTLHHAHQHGVLHRDVKPGNILLDAKGEPHLTDFGLARLVESESSVTQTLEVLGTPSYMAPEQAVGNNEAVSSATDVYGLGAVFYQLLTGHPPFAGGTTFETVRMVLETQPRQPRLYNAKVDRDLETICLKCLEKEAAGAMPRPRRSPKRSSDFCVTNRFNRVALRDWSMSGVGARGNRWWPAWLRHLSWSLPLALLVCSWNRAVSRRNGCSRGAPIFPRKKQRSWKPSRRTILPLTMPICVGARFQAAGIWMVEFGYFKRQ
jgi:serine/threonine protein kinase